MSHGKSALGRYLCRLHIWRCTADVSSSRMFYEPMCAVEGEYEEWRQVVCSKPNPRWKLVQPNTSAKGDVVEMKVYEENDDGVLRSWAERETWRLFCAGRVCRPGKGEVVQERTVRA